MIHIFSIDSLLLCQVSGKNLIFLFKIFQPANNLIAWVIADTLEVFLVLFLQKTVLFFELIDLMAERNFALMEIGGNIFFVFL